MFMKLGNIIPINYELWTTEMDEALMALVLNIEDEAITLCPVHTNLEAAGIFDLIIPPSENSHGILLVVMTKLTKVFPKCSVSSDFLKNQNPELIGELELSEAERKKILDDINIIQHGKGLNKAFSILRGRVLQRESLEYHWANEITQCWDKFLLSSQVFEISDRISDFPVTLGVDKIVNYVQKIINQSIFKDEDSDDAPVFNNVSANEVLPNAAKMTIGTQEMLEDEDLDIKSELQKLFNENYFPEDFKSKLSQIKSDDTSGLLELLIRFCPKENKGK